jgi:transcriptional regulator with XRE-family HTH domain
MTASSPPFSEKLGFLLKALSMSGSQLAADLGVDKSVVRRWLAGAVEPSAHSLTRLTALVAGRVSGFTTLDWDGDLDALAAVLGVDQRSGPDGRSRPAPTGLPIPLFDEILATTARRGGAYEGFFRTTRPYASKPGRFLHDHIMIRMDENGLLRFDMVSGGVSVQGWALPMQHQVSVIGAEMTSGALVFGMFNGVPTVKVGVIDGLILSYALDAGRTPTASAMILERIGEITKDIDADCRRLADLGETDPIAPIGSVPDDLAAHLVRDIGPSQLALGGDWLLRMPLSRSRSSGLHMD